MGIRFRNRGRPVRRWPAARGVVHGDAGNASLDYVGTITVVAGVVLALLLAGPGVGRALAGAVQEALCTAFGVLCDGETETQAGQPDVIPPPSDPCEASSHTAQVSATLAVTFVEVGGGFGFVKARTSDGAWHVTLMGDGKLGATAAVGGEVFVGAGDKNIKVSVQADGTAARTGQYGQVWDFPDEDAANAFIDDAKRHLVREKAVGSIPVIGSVVNDVADAFTGEWDPPEPDEEFLAGGVEISGSASASVLAGVGVSAGAEGLLGVRTKKDGETTYYFEVSMEVGGNAGIAFGPSASGRLGGKGVVAVTVGPDGQVTKLTLEGTAGTSGDASLHADVSSLPAFLRSGLGASENTTTRVWSASLDLTDPKARDATAQFLVGVGIPGFLPTQPAGRSLAADSTAHLFDVFQEQGTVTILDYSGSTETYGAGAKIALGAKLGIGAEGGFIDNELTGAQYWNGQSFVPWTECK